MTDDDVIQNMRWLALSSEDCHEIVWLMWKLSKFHRPRKAYYGANFLCWPKTWPEPTFFRKVKYDSIAWSYKMRDKVCSKGLYCYE